MKKKKTEKVSFYKFFRKFPNEQSARLYFENEIWGKTGRYCPHCGSAKTVEVKNEKPAPCRCKDCRKHWSVRTKSVLTESNIPLNKWLLAILITTKGVLSYKLARDIDVTQKTAWFLAHRIRKIHEDQAEVRLDFPIEAYETYQRYAEEFATRQNSRPLPTIEQIGKTVEGVMGKRLKYKELIS